jgi:Family of unknown function (DUF6498)
MRWINLLFVLAINAVPLIGVKYYDWSALTVVALYWVENLLIAVFTCARIALHRTLTRKRGHWRTGQLGTKVNDKPSGQGLLGEYATMAFVFTLAHGVFVGAFILLAGQNHDGDPLWVISGEQLRRGALWMAAAMTLEFIIDAATMRSRSFAWIKSYVGQRMGRVIVMHLAIIFGMWGMMATQSPFAVLYVLIALKTLWDLAASTSGRQTSDLPAQPPAWTLKFANKVGKGGAADFAAKWTRDREDTIRAAREDEEVMPR